MDIPPPSDMEPKCLFPDSSPKQPSTPNPTPESSPDGYNASIMSQEEGDDSLLTGTTEPTPHRKSEEVKSLPIFCQRDAAGFLFPELRKLAQVSNVRSLLGTPPVPRRDSLMGERWAWPTSSALSSSVPTTTATSGDVSVEAFDRLGLGDYNPLSRNEELPGSSRSARNNDNVSWITRSYTPYTSSVFHTPEGHGSFFNNAPDVDSGLFSPPKVQAAETSQVPVFGPLSVPKSSTVPQGPSSISRARRPSQLLPLIHQTKSHASSQRQTNMLDSPLPSTGLSASLPDYNRFTHQAYPQVCPHRPDGPLYIQTNHSTPVEQNLQPNWQHAPASRRPTAPPPPPMPVPQEQSQPAREFRPMDALMYSGSGNVASVRSSVTVPPAGADPKLFSPSYHGMHSRTNASAEHIANADNCALWLTNLHPETSYQDLLDKIVKVGRIWCTYINEPDNNRHHTAAAKVVFFTPDAAQRLLTYSWTTGLEINGYRVKVAHNRIKYERHAAADATRASRVLIVTGKSDFVNEASLTHYFRARFVFQLDRVSRLIDTGERAVVEYRFGSYRCQAQMGKMALERDQPDGLEKVEFGDDPCEHGETYASYGIAADRIQGKGF